MSHFYEKSADGDLVLRADPDGQDGSDEILRVPSGGYLGVIFTTDGVLHKHGPAGMVERRMGKMREALKSAGPAGEGVLSEMRMLRLPVDELNAEMIEEINACLATTGRVAGLADRLAAMAETPRPA